jgi:hypothetical protein
MQNVSILFFLHSTSLYFPNKKERWRVGTDNFASVTGLLWTTHHEHNMSCYTGFFNVRRGWQSLNTGPRFYLRLIRRTGWLWIYTSRTTDGRPFKPKNAGKLMQRLSTFVRGNNSSGLMNIYKQLRALFACVVCSSLPWMFNSINQSINQSSLQISNSI